MTMLHALLPRTVEVRPGRVVRRFLKPEEVAAEERARKDREYARGRSQEARALKAIAEHVAKLDAKREARRAARAEEYARNRAKETAAHAAWYAANREAERAKQADYYQRNREKIIARVLENRKAKA